MGVGVLGDDEWGNISVQAQPRYRDTLEWGHKMERSEIIVKEKVRMEKNEDISQDRSSTALVVYHGCRPSSC